MKKYTVYFTTKDGDNDVEWCYAESEEDAANIMKHENWDITSIDIVTESK